MKIVFSVVALMLMGVSVDAQTYSTYQQQGGQQQFQPVPYGQQYQVPAQAYVPMQQYQVGPPQYRPMYGQGYGYGYQRPPCYYPRPRGVWGIGPIPLGYYW